MLRSLVAVCGLGAALAGCAAPTMSDVVLARVNGEPITVARLEQGFSSSHQGHGVLLAGSGAVREFLDTTISHELLIQEGRRLGLDEEPDIQRAREALRAKRAGDLYFADRVTRRIRVTEDEIAAAHARLGQRRQARHLLVDTRAEAERALARVRAGEEFGEVARQVSVAETAGRGGDLGIVHWGRLDPRMEAAIWALEPGQVSEPFEADEGWNVVQLVTLATVTPPKLEDARRLIEAGLVREKTRRASVALAQRLMRDYEVTIDERPVVAALAKDGGSPPPPDTAVVRARGETVTLEQALKQIKPEAAAGLAPSRLSRQVRWLLEGSVFRRLLEREGLARGYGADPKVAREVEALTDELVLQHVLAKVILAKVEVTDQDVEAYYRGHLGQFTEPEAVALSAILVEDEQTARDTTAALASGASFAALAHARSRDPNLAATGGRVPGWVTRGKLDPEVDAVVFAMDEGALGVAKGRAGYFVVRVDRRRPERQLPLAQVKARARDAATRQRSRELVREWTAKLRAVSAIEIDERAIETVVAHYESSARQKASGKP